MLPSEDSMKSSYSISTSPAIVGGIIGTAGKWLLCFELGTSTIVLGFINDFGLLYIALVLCREMTVLAEVRLSVLIIPISLWACTFVEH